MGSRQAPVSAAARGFAASVPGLAPCDSQGHPPDIVVVRLAPGLIRPWGRAAQFCPCRHYHATVHQAALGQVPGHEKAPVCVSRPVGGQARFLSFSPTLDDWPIPGFSLWPQTSSTRGEGNAVDTGTTRRPHPLHLVDPGATRSSCLLSSRRGICGSRLVWSTSGG